MFIFTLTNYLFLFFPFRHRTKYVESRLRNLFDAKSPHKFLRIFHCMSMIPFLLPKPKYDGRCPPNKLHSFPQNISGNLFFPTATPAPVMSAPTGNVFQTQRLATNMIWQTTVMFSHKPPKLTVDGSGLRSRSTNSRMNTINNTKNQNSDNYPRTAKLTVDGPGLRSRGKLYRTLSRKHPKPTPTLTFFSARKLRQHTHATFFLILFKLKDFSLDDHKHPP